ncbi:choice-of-anchor I family protein [Paraferrimonas sedimenticola]|uniref:Alkaline phosphatase n=1 Tax=Paraferrimonas sedimenticola TaxID=375674 RepID=A0AA37RXE9_9GAMM|nr:choice-of-anchor I family protein [Paraferrimonas sedimenticola]GLP96457.1 alkaline phosphatase [Paraferrimonas sedimenticola]
MNTSLKPLALILGGLLLTGCNGDDGQNGKDGIDGENGKNTLVRISDIPVGDATCAAGGQRIESGLDLDGNGELSDDEVTDVQTVCAGNANLSVDMVARYQSGKYAVSAAEIVDFHAPSAQVFVVNAQSGKVDVIDASTVTGEKASDPINLNNLTKATELDVAADVNQPNLGGVNSLAIHGDLMAVAIERGDGAGNKKQANGFIAIYQIDEEGNPTYVKAIEAGALPDNVVFTPDGSKILVANEGEPNAIYDLDPLGTVSVIEVTNGMAADTATHIDFSEFNVGGAREAELSPMVKINGPDSSVAEDLEPEYIAVSQDSQTAYVALQENNAVAVIDLSDNSIKGIQALGMKDYGLAHNAIDASDKDDAVNIRTWEGVYGLYQPDMIASYSWKGSNFLVTANEGDAREYDGFTEEFRAGDYDYDLGEGDYKVCESHPNFEVVKDKTQLARYKVTSSMGYDATNNCYSKIVGYGGRSFSIWDDNGNQVFDSGSDFERITASILGSNFNNTNDENKGDNRSDDKGPEPEAVVVGQVGDKLYAFVGLERVGGFMIYDVTNPFDVSFVDYIVDRDFEVTFAVDDGEILEGDPSVAGDLGPEGMKFVPAMYSMTGKPLLIIGSEVSGTTSIYQLDLK